jgi:hypothetical protein
VRWHFSYIWQIHRILEGKEQEIRYLGQGKQKQKLEDMKEEGI